MAKKSANLLSRAVEFVVSRPPLATLLVGSSILALTFLLNLLAVQYPRAGYFRLIVPFVPPFFITRTAKRINMRNAEYDFVRDAEPLIFIGFPTSLSVRNLMEVRPVITSESACRHLKMAVQEILDAPILPPTRFSEATRREVIQLLVSGEGDRRALLGVRVSASQESEKNGQAFLLSAVLKRLESGWKLQMTMIPETQAQCSRNRDSH